MIVEMWIYMPARYLILTIFWLGGFTKSLRGHDIMCKGTFL